MKMTPNYIYACLAISYDENLKNNHIHLISTLYNSKELLEIAKLNEYCVRHKETKYIIYLYNDLVNINKDDTLGIELGIEYKERMDGLERIQSEFLFEIKLGIGFFIGSLILKGLNKDMKYKDIIDLIIGDLLSKDKDFNSIINNVLFVFEGFNWDIIKLLFKECNIEISGGTITKRALLSSVEYNLSLFLILLGVNSKDIYDSFTISKETKSKQKLLKGEFNNIKNKFQSNLEDYKLELNKSLHLYFIFKILEQHIKEISERIKILEDNIKFKKGNISTLEKEKEAKLVKSKNKNKQINSKRVVKSIYNIKIFNDIIERDSLEIKDLKLKLSNLKNKKINLEQSPNYLSLDYLNLELKKLNKNEELLACESNLYAKYKEINDSRKLIKQNINTKKK